MSIYLACMLASTVSFCQTVYNKTVFSQLIASAPTQEIKNLIRVTQELTENIRTIIRSNQDRYLQGSGSHGMRDFLRGCDEYDVLIKNSAASHEIKEFLKKQVTDGRNNAQDTIAMIEKNLQEKNALQDTAID